jgi:hypothetical protein
MTTQMATRRRNPKGGRPFAGDREYGTKRRVNAHWMERWPQTAGRDARIHFAAARERRAWPNR